MTQIARKMIAQFGAKAHWSFDGVQTLCGRGFRNAMVEVGETTHELCKSCTSAMRRLVAAAHVHALDEDATRIATPLYVRITESIYDQEAASRIVAENETFQFGALGWSGGLRHVDLYRASGERVRFDLEYFKKVAVAVDHIDFQPQRKPLPLENPLVRAAYLRAGKSEAERILEVLAERDAFKHKLMGSFVYMTMLADRIEGTSASRSALADEIRQFVRDGHSL